MVLEELTETKKDRYYTTVVCFLGKKIFFQHKFVILWKLCHPNFFFLNFTVEGKEEHSKKEFDASVLKRLRKKFP